MSPVWTRRTATTGSGQCRSFHTDSSAWGFDQPPEPRDKVLWYTPAVIPLGYNTVAEARGCLPRPNIFKGGLDNPRDLLYITIRLCNRVVMNNRPISSTPPSWPSPIPPA